MAKKRSSKKKKQFSLLSFTLKWGFLSAIWGTIAVILVLIYYLHDMPDISKLNENTRTPSITILSSDGQTMATIGNLYGDYVQYDQFPKTLIDAVTSTEDRRFFDHFGIDVFGLFRAFYVNMAAGHVVQGGSTITQQLAKVIFLTHDRTIKRKLQEVFLAFYLEKTFTKQEIITMYLNRIYMGSGNYGMDAAARSYFGKSISNVNLYESAILAGLIKAPSRYSPLNNPALAGKRASQVLDLMVDNGVITTEQLLKNNSGKASIPIHKAQNSYAPYFTDWIKDQLVDYIGVQTGDITVITTFDSKIQKMAENSLLENLASAGEKNHVSQGAIVVMKPDGDVLAMVGGKDYNQSQFNRAYQAYRQPGSSFKLFVYLAALEKGYSPDDIMVDEPLKINKWTPSNWNNQYIGEVSLRDALAGSINTVAIKLARDVGIENVISMAHRLGITSDMNIDLSSALGTSEVNLLELTGAYAHLANFGNAVWPHGIVEILDDKGETIYRRNKSPDTRLLSADVTAKMNDMLVGVVKDGTGKKAQFYKEAAGKTGTSQDARDAWFIGFNHDYVAGVWVGNDDNSPMEKVGGGGLPTVIWQQFMVAANQDKKDGKIAVTEYNVKNKNASSGIWESILENFSDDNKESN